MRKGDHWGLGCLLGRCRVEEDHWQSQGVQLLVHSPARQQATAAFVQVQEVEDEEFECGAQPPSQMQIAGSHRHYCREGNSCIRGDGQWGLHVWSGDGNPPLQPPGHPNSGVRLPWQGSIAPCKGSVDGCLWTVQESCDFCTVIVVQQQRPVSGHRCNRQPPITRGAKQCVEIFALHDWFGNTIPTSVSCQSPTSMSCRCQDRCNFWLTSTSCGCGSASWQNLDAVVNVKLRNGHNWCEKVALVGNVLAVAAHAIPSQHECQETSTRDTANKRSLELCATIVLVLLEDGCCKWCVSVVFLPGQVIGNWYL